MKLIEVIFPAYGYSEDLVHKKTNKLNLIMMGVLVFLVLGSTVINNREKFEVWIAEYPLYIVIFMIIGILPIIWQCIEPGIWIAVLDALIFKSGLTLTQIVRAFLHIGVVFYALRILYTFVPDIFYAVPFILTATVWFSINYYLTMRRVLKYTKIKAGIITGVFAIYYLIHLYPVFRTLIDILRVKFAWI